MKVNSWIKQNLWIRRCDFKFVWISLLPHWWV